MSVDTITATDAHQPLQQPLRKLQIDFLFLDLTSCTRCRGTDRSLNEALIVVADVLHAAGIAVEVTKVHVATEELARAWRFVSSPTIRVNGSDIALDLRESSCGSEACTDGCGDQIACRVWVYRGQEYTEPPTGADSRRDPAAHLRRAGSAAPDAPLRDAREPAALLRRQAGSGPTGATRPRRPAHRGSPSQRGRPTRVLPARRAAELL